MALMTLLRKTPPVFFLLSSLVGSAYAMAPIHPYTPPQPVPGAATQTRAYAGIRWLFGAKIAFEGMLGIQNVRVNASGNLEGGEVMLATPINSADGITLKVSYLKGDINGQSMIGLGYRTGSGWLGGVGYMAPFGMVDIDYSLLNGFMPSVGVHTLDKYSKP